MPVHSITRTEINRAAAVVDRVVRQLGMVPDSRLAMIARQSRESEEVDNVVVGIFITEPEQKEWVEVRSVVHKDSGKFYVMISDTYIPWPSEFTRRIQLAVISALRESFPQSEVRIQKGAFGPALGP